MFEIKLINKEGIEIIKASDFEESTNNVTIYGEKEEGQNFSMTYLVPYHSFDKMVVKESWEKIERPYETCRFTDENLELIKLTSDIREMRDIQGRSLKVDNSKSPYMLGLYNGLEMALALIEEREPEFMSIEGEQDAITPCLNSDANVCCNSIPCNCIEKEA